MISALMIDAQQCHPPVPTISATSQCPAVVPVSAQRLCLTDASQCRLSVPPIRDTSL
ncbi:unnamed protein product, partial [Staurois parvus]